MSGRIPRLRGLDYTVTAVSDNLTLGPLPLLLCPSGTCFVTYHDRDVILVNDDSRRLHVAHRPERNAIQPDFDPV
jgi:hypothetical protein